MLNRRLIALALLAVVAFGTLLLTGGWAWYLRSARYRNSCAIHLSQSLALPAEIAAVVPRSRHTREFRGVRVWLPERRGEAAFCESATVIRRPTATQPEAYDLDLRGGHCEISARTWLRQDYRTVLESGLRPGFDPGGPHEVVFHGMDLTFERDRFRAALNDAGGVVSFDQPQHGRATVTCSDLNAHPTSQPVTLQAEFSPQAHGIRLDRIELIVPELPIATVGLQDLAGLGLRSGSFAGRVIYRETDTGREFTASGKVLGVPLVECTAAFFSPPWRGIAREVELQELSLDDGSPLQLRFRGVFTGLVLEDVLGAWELPSVGGNLVLRIDAAEFSPAGIERLVASGRCTEIALANLAQAIGRGRMTGRARVVIDDLTIQQNHLASLDAEITVAPTADGENWIERNLLSDLLERTLGFPLPSFLPDRFQYAELGVRLEVRDELLYVFGTHGPRQKVILSVTLAGQNVPVVFEPETPFDLRPMLDELRTRLLSQLAERLHQLTHRGAAPLVAVPTPAEAPTLE